MRSLILKVSSLVVLLFSLEVTWAQKCQNLGVGIILGAPTALSLKYFVSEERAFDGGLAFDLDDYILLYGDFLHHFPGAFTGGEEFLAQITPYVGAGPLIIVATDERRKHKRDYFDDKDDDVALGLRIPLGMEWRSDRIPVGVALEVAPGLTVLPGTEAFVQGGLALRYYF